MLRMQSIIWNRQQHPHPDKFPGNLSNMTLVFAPGQILTVALPLLELFLLKVDSQPSLLLVENQRNLSLMTLFQFRFWFRFGSNNERLNGDVKVRNTLFLKANGKKSVLEYGRTNGQGPCPSMWLSAKLRVRCPCPCPSSVYITNH